MIRLLPFLVWAVTVLAFLPTIGGEFLNWDDAANFVKNPHFRGLGPEQLRWMFLELHLAHYIPLSWVSLGLDHVLWGMDPRGYHLTNVLLHGVNAALVYSLALRLWRHAGIPDAVRQTGTSADSSPRTRLWAAAGALFFSLHPLRSESVAWITERRDLLCVLFLLLALRVYEGGRSPRRLALCLLWSACAMLSKPLGVMAGPVLLVLDAYPLRRFVPGGLFRRENARLVIEKLPFFAVALATGLLEIAANQEAGQFRGLEADRGAGARLAQAAYVLAAPVAKTFWPFGLSPIYAHQRLFDPGRAVFWLCGAAAAAAIALLVWQRRRWPAAAAAGAAYALFLAPYLSLADGTSINHDRYSLFPSIGLSILLAGLAARAASAAGRAARVWNGAAAVVLAALFALTQRQNAVWRDSRSLWAHAVAVDPSLFVAHHNLGAALTNEGRHEESLAAFGEAIRLNPRYAPAYHNRGVSLATLGRAAEAERDYREALRLQPWLAPAHNGLGLLALERGDLTRAESFFEEARRNEPAFAEAWSNLGYVRLLQGRREEAGTLCREALKRDASLKEAHNHLGLLAAEEGNFAEAAAHYGRALALDPAFAEAQSNLANALAALGDVPAALALYEQALRLRPLPQTHFNLGLVLEREGDQAGADRHFREALRLDPGFAEARKRLNGKKP